MINNRPNPDPRFNPNDPHTLKEWAEHIVVVLKDYFHSLFDGYDFTDTQKKLIKFEQELMPPEKYSGGQSIDHVLFRRFLHIFDPEAVEERVKSWVEEKLEDFKNEELAQLQNDIRIEEKAVYDAMKPIPTPFIKNLFRHTPRT